jgi:hypothetical protein
MTWFPLESTCSKVSECVCAKLWVDWSSFLVHHCYTDKESEKLCRGHRGHSASFGWAVFLAKTYESSYSYRTLRMLLLF